MKKRLVYKVASEYSVRGPKDIPLSVEYHVYQDIITVESKVHGFMVPTKITAFQLKLAVSKRKGSTSVPWVNLDFGTITPISGEMSGLTYGLSRRHDLTLFGVSKQINEFKRAQKATFQETASMQFKRNIGYFREKTFIARHELVMQEVDRLCHSL